MGYFGTFWYTNRVVFCTRSFSLFIQATLTHPLAFGSDTLDTPIVEASSRTDISRELCET